MPDLSLFETQPQFKDPKKYADFLFRSVSTSTAIEIGPLTEDILAALHSYNIGDVERTGGVSLENFLLSK